MRTHSDDTLVTARGGNYNEAARLAEVGIHHIVDCIKAPGLRVFEGHVLMDVVGRVLSLSSEVEVRLHSERH